MSKKNVGQEKDFGPRSRFGRMRKRLLAAPGSLTDYEILEMVLLLGTPRAATRSRAKSLIGELGSLAGALTASQCELEDANVPMRAAEAFELIIESAACLATADRITE